ncbi:MAG: VCBS repeat-containing protein [Chloracidobacterium sp.]|nr:VCBS repeat-containing protein [Chloracidobacterium sp.]
MKSQLNNCRRATLILLSLLIAYGAAMGSGIDTTFTPQIQTTSFGTIAIQRLVYLPDGKVIVGGSFNTYNECSVGLLIRLNADGTLDESFNNNILTQGNPEVRAMPDGTILLQGNGTLSNGMTFSEDQLIRLTADGNFDPSFNPGFTGNVDDIRFDASGRIVVYGNLRISVNGTTVQRAIVRLTPDWVLDPTFTPVPHPTEGGIALQGNKIIYGMYDGAAHVTLLLRINEDGSRDTSFAWTVYPRNGMQRALTQADNKIVFSVDNKIFRVHADGGMDDSFQTPVFSGSQDDMRALPDGRIAAAYHAHTGPSGSRVHYLLPNGSADPASPSYFYAWSVGQTMIQPDGRMMVGQSIGTGNLFLRLLPSGTLDPSFNPNGAGPQWTVDGKVRTVHVQNDGRLLIGGEFDKVNGVLIARMARLNSDGILDPTFSLKTTPTGNYFERLGSVYNILPQTDGRILVSGDFDYWVNGTQRSDVVRIGPNGEIDASFNLSHAIRTQFPQSGGYLSTNKIVVRADGKLLVGATTGGPGPLAIPTLLNPDGTKDTSFDPNLFPTANQTSAHDIALVDGGRILVSGRFSIGNINGNVAGGYLARLNPDGTRDPAFTMYQANNIFAVARLAPLSGGETLMVRWVHPSSDVVKLDPSGGIDNSFHTGSGANGRINSIEVLANGQILIAGSFSTYNGQPRQNIALLNADGTLAEGPGRTNKEVFATELDRSGRLLIGGEFTSAASGSQQVSVRHLARFNALVSTPRTTPFDYDGDGRSDVSVYRPSTGMWYLQNSTAGFSAVRFGVTTDKIAPADYDGDGKTDIAVFRPSDGGWSVINSSTGIPMHRSFGNDEDVPVPADYDGDGKADICVFRASQGVWYRQNSSDGATVAMRFGQSGDVPAVGDFDGDGKADIGIWRPSQGEWYYARSSDGTARGESFGTDGDTAVPADYDGDGRADIAVYRPSTSTWHFRNSSNGTYRSIVLVNATGIPTPADYDGDGKADAAVFRSVDGMWHRQNSSNSSYTNVQWGLNGDTPTPGR